MPWRPVVVCVGLLVASVSPAAAQTKSDQTVVNLVNHLFEPTIPFNPTNERLLSLADYNRRQSDSREGILAGVGTALASFPLGASSAGFTFRRDAVTGESVFKSTSFGPFFVERSVTSGKGVFNVGFSFQSSAFDVLQGLDLKATGFPTRTAMGTYTLDGSRVGDAFRATLDTTAQVFGISGSYGISDRLDIGWGVPFASLRARGRSFRDYNGGFEWDKDLPNVRALYPGKIGTLTLEDTEVRHSGFGDVTLRAKYAIGSVERPAAFLSGEVRVPTGNEDNLLGTGKTSVRIFGGSSVYMHSGSINVNAGYTGGGLTNEFNFSGGADFVPLRRKTLTLSAELIAQTLTNAVTSVSQLTSYDQLESNVAAGFLERRVVISYGFWNRGTTTLARAAVGAKYTFSKNWLVIGSVLVRLNRNGYQPKLVPFVGIEHTFARNKTGSGRP